MAWASLIGDRSRAGQGGRAGRWDEADTGGFQLRTSTCLQPCPTAPPSLPPSSISSSHQRYFSGSLSLSISNMHTPARLGTVRGRLGLRATKKFMSMDYFYIICILL
jgi:hypothetical protein